MKISRDWLSDFIEWKEKDPQVIADHLTRRMGEVDEVEEQGQFLDKCVVGKVLTLEKHPNADKLSLCTIETDQGVKTVVCGGTNLRKGMLIAFAHVGATVKHGDETMTLGKATIRGVESSGMICAAEELELDDMFPSKPEDGNRPIVDLAELGTSNKEPGTRNLKPGTDLRSALGMNDVIWHIDNHAITNRPDLFSHIGVARELVAMGLATWKRQPPKKRPAFAKKDLPFNCKNNIPTLIPRYHATLIEYSGEGETPEWMRRRLAATGWRSINLPVDITNYVAMEIGMPLHSFDADDIAGTIVMRTAKAGEKIVTLDGTERKLNKGAVILEDDKGIFDLLGIMGGLRSSTKATTRRAYLHSAIVDGSSIRRTVIHTGLRTDAATVYEKGIPLVVAEKGFVRAVELFLELMPDARIASKEESWGKEVTKKPLKIDHAVLERYIGIPIKAAESKKILTDLGFAVKGGDTLTVTAPKWRNDIATRQDLVEEVARIYGYANITPTVPAASISLPYRDPRTNQLRDALKEQSYFEFLHLAFVSPEQLKKCGLDPADAPKIENPLGEELSLMRTSLLPTLLETVARELPRTENRLKAFEVGHTFSKKSENMTLMMLIAAKGPTTLKDDPFLIAKADILHGLKRLGHPATLRVSKEATASYAHPGRTAELICNGKRIGMLTEVHPNIRANFGLEHRVAMCLLDLETLLKETPETNIAASLPVYPPVEFDETVPLTSRSYEERIASAKKTDALLESIALTNLYEKGAEKNITLRFTYRSAERTLTQEEAKKAHSKVLQALANHS